MEGVFACLLCMWALIRLSAYLEWRKWQRTMTWVKPGGEGFDPYFLQAYIEVWSKEIDDHLTVEGKNMPPISKAYWNGIKNGYSPITSFDFNVIMNLSEWKMKIDIEISNGIQDDSGPDFSQSLILWRGILFIRNNVGKHHPVRHKRNILMFMMDPNSNQIRYVGDIPGDADTHGTNVEILWKARHNNITTFAKRKPQTPEEETYYQKYRSLTGFEDPGILERMGFEDVKTLHLIA